MTVHREKYKLIISHAVVQGDFKTKKNGSRGSKSKSCKETTSWRVDEESCKYHGVIIKKKKKQEKYGILNVG